MQFIVKIIERHFTFFFSRTESLKSCGYLPIRTLRFGWGTFVSPQGVRDLLQSAPAAQLWRRHRREQLCLQTSWPAPQAPTAPQFVS